MFDLKYGKLVAQPGVERKEDDEPCFVLRGQDALSVGALEAYRKMCDNAGCDIAFLLQIDRATELMRTWKPKKLPD